MKATQTIWRTVVFAGAMLGAPACHKKPANTTPSNTTTTPDTTTKANDTTAKPDPNATPTDGTGDPCGGGEAVRPRGTDENGGGAGRGFVLS